MSKDKKKDKRPNGDGTLRQRTVMQNGKKYSFWEGTISIGVDPISGKPQRRTFTGKSQGEVSQKMREAGSAVDRGEFFEASKLTLQQWYETWLSEYMGDKKPLTVLQYQNMGENHVIPGLGAVKLGKLTSP